MKRAASSLSARFSPRENGRSFFSLRDGLSFCAINDQIVFLDLVENRYFALPAGARRELVELLDNADDTEMGAPHALLKRNIVVECPTRCSIGVASIDSPAMSVLESSRGGTSPFHVGRAIAARAVARFQLATRPLNRIIDDIRKAKSTLAPGSVDHRRAEEEVAWSVETSKRFLDGNGRCLADSVAAIRLLVVRKAAANIVFGVRLNPFMAHCWVQAGTRLVTDRRDQVLQYTPILVV
jgi:hypothetical protein